MRNCYDCGIAYPRHKSRPSKDGEFRCKKCNIRNRNKKYSTSNKGKTNGIAYRQKNSEHAVERATLWAKENPERRQEIEYKYRQSEKGRVSQAKRGAKHYWADPEYKRKKAIARHHGTTPDFIEELRDRQPFCQLCGETKRLTLDHMNPVNNGGKATRENIQSLCGPCNSWKSDNLFLANGGGYLVGESYGRA